MNQPVGWYCDDRRYVEYTLTAWAEVVTLTAEVNKLVPTPRSVSQDQEPVLYALVRRREFWSDSVKIFGAMSVEAWINFYGVVRLSEAIFNKKLEYKPILVKLKILLDLTKAPHHPLVDIVGRIAARRNELVHRKTFQQGVSLPPTVPIPESTREGLEDTVLFFREFVIAVPEATGHVPPQALSQTLPIAPP